MSAVEQVRATLEPVMAPLGLQLEDVTVAPAGKRRVVRVVVDTDLSGLDPADGTSPIEPLSLDQVAEATRAVSDALDVSNPLGDTPYLLEVSSPGVGRPLTHPDHFRRNVGRLVEVRHGETTTTGRLLDVSTDALVLELPPTKRGPTGTRAIPFSEVPKGSVQVEFKRTDPDHPDRSETDPSDPEEEN
jgi:ribosome maturation factor RimP